MKNLQEKLVNILRAEVKPALGCTEPVAVALACAKAKETLEIYGGIVSRLGIF